MLNVQDQPLEQNDEIQQDIDDSESNEHDGDGHEDDQEQEVDDDDSDLQETSSSCSSIPEVPCRSRRDLHSPTWRCGPRFTFLERQT